MNKEQKDKAFLEHSNSIQKYCTTFDKNIPTIESMDVYQETYIAWINSNYQEGQMSILEYLKMLCRNQYKEQVRKYYHQNDKDSNSEDTPVSTPEDVFNYKQLRGLIDTEFWSFVNPKKSEEKRTYINLCLLGYDSKQIMDKLNINYNRLRVLRDSLIPKLQEYIKMVNK